MDIKDELLNAIDILKQSEDKDKLKQCYLSINNELETNNNFDSEIDTMTANNICDSLFNDNTVSDILTNNDIKILLSVVNRVIGNTKVHLEDNNLIKKNKELKEASIIQEAEIKQLRKELAEKNKQSESNSDLNSSFTDLKKKYNELLYKTQQYESILSQLNLTSKEPCEVSDEDIDNLYLQSLSNKNVERHKSAFFVYDKNGNKFIPKSYYVISNVIEGR